MQGTVGLGNSNLEMVNFLRRLDPYAGAGSGYEALTEGRTERMLQSYEPGRASDGPFTPDWDSTTHLGRHSAAVLLWCCVNTGSRTLPAACSNS